VTASDIRWDEDDDGVLTLTFTRDAKLNAVSPGMLDVLKDAAAELDRRDDLRVLLLTAEGRYFTAGMDIVGRETPPEERPEGPASGSAVRRYHRQLHVFLDELEAIEKPIILAAQGPCLGVGVELAVSCDFRFASDAAEFSLPELSNLGVLPGSGGISRLTKLVGPHWSRWLVMAGRSIDAAQALAIGLVHEVHPVDEFAARVRDFAHSLTERSGEALGLAKLAIDTAAYVDRTTARHFDRVANTLLLTSDEHRRMVLDFKERRANRRAQPAPETASREES